jgi:hypothetical protein
VHVWRGDGEVVIELGRDGHAQTIRDAAGMRTADIARAFWIVEGPSEYRLTCWRRFHG